MLTTDRPTKVETVSVLTFSTWINPLKPCKTDEYTVCGHEMYTIAHIHMQTGDFALTFFLTSDITADVELRGQVEFLTDGIVLGTKNVTLVFSTMNPDCSILDALPAENLEGIEDVDIQISLKPTHIQPLPMFDAELLSIRNESSTPLVVPKETFTKLFPGFLRNWIPESDGTFLWPSDAPQGSLELIRSWIETGAVPDFPLSEFNAMVTLLENLGAKKLLQHIFRQRQNRFDSVIDVVPPP